MKYFTTTGAVLLSVLTATAGGIKFDPEDEASILSATKQYATNLMSIYKGGAPNTAKEDVGIWPQPHYWWEGGAAWGGMIEYSQFTGDNSYIQVLQQALTANYGPANDFILSYRKSQTGNDDQAFWALAVMSALEYQFPDPAQAPADYLKVVTNAFENIMGRWDTTTCGGGLKWQIYPENAYGYNYKNSISNGCAFALGARLARYTGEQKYADWSVKIYDWTKKTGLISDKFEVFDGTDDKTNCATVSDKTQWTYNNAMFLHGSAFMYDFTKGDQTWKDRTSGFLSHAETLFFKPYENATDIMYEWACETGESGRHCNLDQQSFKAYLSRFMGKTALLAPFTKDKIVEYLKASAVGAAKSCSGGADGMTCGSKWYTGSWDGMSGVGQQLSALEVTQALLMIKKGTLPAKNTSQKPSTSVAPSSSAAPTPSASSTLPAPSAPSASPSSMAASSTLIPTSEGSAPSMTAPASSSFSQVHLPTKIPASEGPASKAPQAATSKVPDVIEGPQTVPTPAAPTAGTSVPSSIPGGLLGGMNSTASSSCVASVTVTVTVPPTPKTTTCIPNVTITVTVPPNSAVKPTVSAASSVTTIVPIVPSISTTIVPIVPSISTTISPVAPPANTSISGNSTLPSPSGPEQFLGAASALAASTSVLAVLVMATVFILV
ncbi:hypothetical protein CFE70_006030 [Pyrenophora teres f. teres 0-1]|uniref:mannan endo-1,6-alpha-mannosidase n=2 Tax=Pyrenophora teres f. teres TaxID=97479 RepID=E3RFW4_PYRTT|nr:hypothetical protein PTT_06645 [Pyrenophora teres f. teres 0-1]KAE8838486.1 hypothetical protein HRS9139_02869 [Pyrenophora teres f. teres]KAE8844451.1 hypothetical protein PTNB85_02716 [Pyrenophora teres f. teres]KAE8847352.1 hypothetical protein HRS9122_04259 [Pyrenophora teres f. teres]KAE8866402.1 hypothetical protein PTNB29_03549 [Pyrenophora teres f. teres]